LLEAVEVALKVEAAVLVASVLVQVCLLLAALNTRSQLALEVLAQLREAQAEALLAAVQHSALLLLRVAEVVVLTMVQSKLAALAALAVVMLVVDIQAAVVAQATRHLLHRAKEITVEHTFNHLHTTEVEVVALLLLVLMVEMVEMVLLHPFPAAA
jgi:uncharacterized membrane protein